MASVFLPKLVPKQNWGKVFLSITCPRPHKIGGFVCSLGTTFFRGWTLVQWQEPYTQIQKSTSSKQKGCVCFFFGGGGGG